MEMQRSSLEEVRELQNAQYLTLEKQQAYKEPPPAKLELRLGSLDEQLDTFYKDNMLTTQNLNGINQTLMKLKNDILNHFQKEVNDPVQIVLYGSTTNGLAVKDCYDLDLTILVPVDNSLDAQVRAYYESSLLKGLSQSIVL